MRKSTAVAVLIAFSRVMADPGATKAASPAPDALAQASAAATGDWPQYKATEAGDGYNAAETELSRATVPGLKLSWTARVGEELSINTTNAPVVANGVAFIGSAGFSTYGLHAFDVATQAQLWFGSTELGRFPGDLPYRPRFPPAVSDGIAYLMGDFPSFPDRPLALFAFAAEGCGSSSCPPIWSMQLPGIRGAAHNAPRVAGGVIYLAGGNRLFAISASTHAVLWTATPGDEIATSPIVSNGVVYLVSQGGLHAYPVGCRSDGGSCSPSWSSTDVGILFATPAASGGFVFVTSSFGGSLHVFEESGCGGASCSPSWSLPLTTDPQMQLGSPVVANGVVYVGSFGTTPDGFFTGSLIAVSASTRSVLWTSTDSPGFLGTIAAANGVVYAPSFREWNGSTYMGAVHAYPAACSGACVPLWTGPKVQSEYTAPVVVDGALYVANPSGFDVYRGAGAATLEIDPTEVVFRDAPVRKLKRAELIEGARTVTLVNRGGSPITVSEISTVRGTFSDFRGRGQRDCLRSLDPDEACDFTMYFEPQALGERTDTLQVFHDGPGSPQTAVLRGKGAEGELEIQPTAVVFADQRVGKLSRFELIEKAQTVTLYNSGTVPVEVSEISTVKWTSTEFYGRGQGECRRILYPSEICTFTMYFQPSALGERSDTLEVFSDAAHSPQTAELRGRGVEGKLEIQPASLAFRDAPLRRLTPAELAAGARTVELHNVGTVAVTITDISTVQGNAGDFQLRGLGGCKGTLSPAEVCSFTVNFKPMILGQRTDTLQVFDDAEGSPQTARLEGRGVQPTVAVQPGTLVFPPQVLGTFGPSLPVLVTNTGTVAVDFANRTARFLGPFAYGPIGPTSCAGLLEPGATCTIDVVFTPHRTGPAAGFLHINNDAEPNPQIVALVGQAIP